jgi:hypothetical protein
LGYVGLPLAEAFAQKLKVIGFDLDKQKVFALQKSPDDRQLTTETATLSLPPIRKKSSQPISLFFAYLPRSPKQNFLTCLT